MPEARNAAARGAVNTTGERNDHDGNGSDDQSTAVEQAYAGALLLCVPSTRRDALAVAGPDDVADPWCRTVVAAVAEMTAAGSAVDLVLVADRLDRTLPSGPRRTHVRSDLFALTAACPLPTHAVDYARTVARNAARRRLGLIGRRLAEVAPHVDDMLLQRLVAATSYLPEVAR